MGAPGVAMAFVIRGRGGFGGVTGAAGTAFAPGRLRRCLFRSLLSLFRYAALQGRGIKREI